MLDFYSIDEEIQSNNNVLIPDINIYMEMGRLGKTNASNGAL